MVTADQDEGGIQGSRVDGNADAVIAPLPHLVADGDEPHYDPVTVEEHVTAKLNGSRAGVKNTIAVREAARVLASSSNSPHSSNRWPVVLSR